MAEENGFPLPGPPSDMPPPPAPDGFDLPAPPPLSGDENIEGRKMPKQHIRILLKLFSVWLQNAQFEWLLLCLTTFTEIFVSLNWITVFPRLSLSLTQLRVLGGHEYVVILLALALFLWGSAWAPVLARSTRARFFCLLLNHVRLIC